MTELLSPQQKKARATRAALLKAAKKKFTEEGYFGSSLDSIVSEAGVTKGALFHHFKDKAALFKQVWLELEQNMNDQANEVANRVGKEMREENPYAAFLAGCEVYFDHVTKPDYRRIIMMDGAGIIGVYEWRRIESAMRTATIARGLDILFQSGAIRTPPTKSLAIMICGAVNGAGFALAREEEGAHKEDFLARIEATLRRL